MNDSNLSQPRQIKNKINDKFNRDNILVIK